MKFVMRINLLMLAIGVLTMAWVQPAAAQCPNEALRSGRSAYLPDCRAFELVTPQNLGRTADMNFENSLDHAVVSFDGEHAALEAKGAFVEPGVSNYGTIVTFSRNSGGWVMKSVTGPEMQSEKLRLELLSPDFSEIGIRAYGALGAISPQTGRYEVGPVGGPYVILAQLPNQGVGSSLVGANAGTESVAGFSAVIVQSPNHELTPPGPELQEAQRTQEGYPDLYRSSSEKLSLINTSGGKLISPCGAALGGSEGEEAGTAINAVSAEGSRVIFVSPGISENSCHEEPQLYMRDYSSGDTLNLSEPEGVSAEGARSRIFYDGAARDGSKVFFTTPGTLTPSAAERPGKGPYLYEYDLSKPAEHRLTMIADSVPTYSKINPIVVVSGDGSTVYYESGAGLFRYNTGSDTNVFVAGISPTLSAYEPSYTTPNGDYLVFASGLNGVKVAGPNGYPEVETESRGFGHNELYRYDSIDGSVMCVSCGSTTAPEKGKVLVPEPLSGLLGTTDTSRVPVEISDDGQRVFFQTSAALVLQDTNRSGANSEAFGSLGGGADVYEWEAFGAEEAPGVSCNMKLGCTHLISSGESVGAEYFLGASQDGRDVFLTSAAQMTPNAAPEFTNIYDARIEGGFTIEGPPAKCLSCQGVGSPPPLFGVPSSEAFVGAGNAPTTGKSPKKRISHHNVVRHACAKQKLKGRGKAKRKHKCVASRQNGVR